MPDRWTSFCRACTPAPLRAAVFDPAVADLVQGACLRRGHRSWFVRLGARVALPLLVAWTVVQCRLLHARASSAPGYHRPGRQSGKGIMSRSFTVVIRRLWREPRFTAAVVLTLAVGLGANLTVFTFVDAYLLAPLSVPQSDALLRVGGDGGGGRSEMVSYPNFDDARTHSAAAIDLAAHTQTDALVGPPDAAQVRPVELVSGNYFRVLKLTPQIGRFIDDADDRTELAQPVVVIGDRYWHSRFGGRPGVIGESLVINGATFQVIGVAPAGFGGTYAARRMDLWTPITMQQVVRPRGLSITRRGWGWLAMIGRPAPGSTRGDAERALSQAAASIEEQFPGAGGTRPFGFVVEGVSALSNRDIEQLSPLLWTAFAFTGLLFLATCATMAGLMHSRLASRRRELAIRQSLGAGRIRMMSEWMLECLMLALCGGAAALVVARLTAGALATVDVPSSLGGLSLATPLQWPVLAYTFGLSVVGAVVFGLGSGWKAGRQMPVQALKADGGMAVAGAGSARMWRTMVVVQVCASVVLLMVASLLASSLRKQSHADPGFDADAIGLFSVNLQRQRVPDAEWPALTSRLLDVARSVPGVESADVALRAPLESSGDSIGIQIPGYEMPEGQSIVSIDFTQVGPQYFSTLGIPFERGGPWEVREGQPPSVVVNHTMAERYWPGADPVGRSVRIGPVAGTVSGVVSDSAYYDLWAPPPAYLYLPAHVQPPGTMVVHLRAAAGVDPRALAHIVAKAIASADSRLAAYDVMSFSDLRQVPMFPSRMLAASAGVFGGVSLLLTVVGLYGVITASVGARTREIGVRLALGAAPDELRCRVIGDALKLAAVGGAIGLAVGYLAARQLQGWLVGVEPFEVQTVAGLIVVVTVVATASAWEPARRAARIDPVQALR